MQPNFAYTRKSLDVRDMTIKYWDEGSGPTLVLIHGIGSQVENWAWVIPTWIKSYRVIALDLPGFGESPVPSISARKVDLPFAAEIVAEFLHRAEIKNAIIMGHSMGGGIAIQLAIKYPELIRGLVLTSSMGFGSDIDFVAKILSLPILGELLFKPNQKNMKNGLDQIFYKDVNQIAGADEFVDIICEQFNRPNAIEWYLGLLRSGVGIFGQKFKFNCAELQSVSVPTSIIWGDSDPLFPIAHAEKAKNCIGGKLTILPKTGHSPMIERPSDYMAIVDKFITSLSSS